MWSIGEKERPFSSQRKLPFAFAKKKKQNIWDKPTNISLFANSAKTWFFPHQRWEYFSTWLVSFLKNYGLCGRSHSDTCTTTSRMLFSNMVNTCPIRCDVEALWSFLGEVVGSTKGNGPSTRWTTALENRAQKHGWRILNWVWIERSNWVNANLWQHRWENESHRLLGWTLKQFLREHVPSPCTRLCNVPGSWIPPVRRRGFSAMAVEIPLRSRRAVTRLEVSFKVQTFWLSRALGSLTLSLFTNIPLKSESLMIYKGVRTTNRIESDAVCGTP